MPVNRRSVTMMSAPGTKMNKYSNPRKGDSYYGYTDGIQYNASNLQSVICR